MISPLRFLHLEDDLRDAELVLETLENDGICCQVTRVETEADFIASLEQGGFCLILADYTLPSFDGLSALKIARQRCPHIPLIFVSGTLDEEVAIEALKVGASGLCFQNTALPDRPVGSTSIAGGGGTSRSKPSRRSPATK
ncbi:MAG TPA: response regulator [Chthoniobacterales bacterium]